VKKCMFVCVLVCANLRKQRQGETERDREKEKDELKANTNPLVTFD